MKPTFEAKFVAPPENSLRHILGLQNAKSNHRVGQLFQLDIQSA